jgi:dUTP pyrophosphatase
MNIPIKLLTPTAKIPTYGTDGAACFDFYSDELTAHVVEPGFPFKAKTGIAIEVPPGHVMLVYSRSGHGFRNSVRLANCVGVVDSDYRGEVMVKLVCDEGPSLRIEPGDRIAQGTIMPIQQVTFIPGDTLSQTDRGSNGFGSTGS